MARTKKSSQSDRAAPIPETVGSVLRSLLPSLSRNSKPPRWPPDLFALAATLLVRSGAYRRVLDDAWPGPERERYAWPSEAKQIGRLWRSACLSRGASLPPEVLNWWEAITGAWDQDLSRAADVPVLHNALVSLCAVADEASEGAGVSLDIGSTSESESREFLVEADICLIPGPDGSSLCKLIHPSRARVLPKLHTPQSGLTIRSMTHSLALCPGHEVRPEWQTMTSRLDELSLNLLLVPWPFEIQPCQITATRVPPRRRSGVPEQPGLFTYSPGAGGQDFPGAISRLVDSATDAVGRLDGVVLPELALTSEQQEILSNKVFSRRGPRSKLRATPPSLLISGVADSPTSPGDHPGENVVIIHDGHRVLQKQSKHHRWCLDRSQIEQYGLGTTLYPQVSWWEHIPLNDRKLIFLGVRPWMTMCVLICEDLARPDPAGELLRAIGPNLVIALLMDGPQLAHRWPGRYATVLADDPGSSVLTLTSLGMSELSRPRSGPGRPRVIGLWKDSQSGVVEIELPLSKKAAVLNITYGYQDEPTVDRRHARRRRGLPVLSGIHFIS